MVRFRDDNNKWLIKPFDKDALDEISFVKHGDLVRLEHLQTRRNLHTHREKAPITAKHFQITGKFHNIFSTILYFNNRTIKK